MQNARLLGLPDLPLKQAPAASNWAPGSASRETPERTFVSSETLPRDFDQSFFLVKSARNGRFCFFAKSGHDWIGDLFVSRASSTSRLPGIRLGLDVSVVFLP